ncbi:MAG TPA: condensation domain-containing protein, partial [Longimicrobiaceae bacterium]
MTQPTVDLSPAKRALREARLKGLYRAAPIVRRAEGADPPLSFSQERLWFLDRLQPGSTAYNLVAGLRLSGPLDVAVMERAVGEIVRRHEALRTTFAEAEGVPVQVVHPFDGFRLAVEDLSALDSAAREAAVAARAAAETAHVFDLGTGPLFRATLLRLAAQEHALVFCVHHIVNDAWSFKLVLDELTVLYGAFRNGRPSPLPDLPVQYADYAAWQRAGGQGAEEWRVAYWRR